MAAIVPVLAEVEINLYIFWQPERGVLLRKGNWSILNHLMLAEQTNFGHGFDHIGFHPHDLKVIGSDPCPSFQGHGENLPPAAIAVHMVGTVAALAEVD